jgi:hypothetical protein
VSTERAADGGDYADSIASRRGRRALWRPANTCIRLAQKLLGALAGMVLIIAAVAYQAAGHTPRWVNTEQLGAVRLFPAWLRPTWLCLRVLWR